MAADRWRLVVAAVDCCLRWPGDDPQVENALQKMLLMPMMSQNHNREGEFLNASGLKQTALRKTDAGRPPCFQAVDS